uniref:Rho GDP-dissociation inhibitor n=2 Tax=Octactis speculum TaxID=3111310 RepID=A0A7S2F4P2_9STRA|mmetsp:Transcript_12205/g.16131  ORF Transcript_12205/g.16131 Transcript_12205/m.16131 type:complete len:103 (+) Transcript_12205:166-474(+)
MHLKQGSNYKFRVSFKVQHEIVTGLKFTTKVSKMGVNMSNDNIVLGSYAPQSDTHNFEFPRNDWLETPSGMMARGNYTAKCQFSDGNNVQHIDYSYPVKIIK